MPTRNVELPEHQEELIETLVRSGRYQDASEVLRDGLRLVEQREAEDGAKMEALREAARVGVAALDRGEYREFERIEDLQSYLNNLSEKVVSGAAEKLHSRAEMACSPGRCCRTRFRKYCEHSTA